MSFVSKPIKGGCIAGLKVNAKSSWAKLRPGKFLGKRGSHKVTSSIMNAVTDATQPGRFRCLSSWETLRKNGQG